MEIMLRRHATVMALACLAFFVFVLAHGWVAEDAYITFRVIDNALNGYGLRWNIHERVQVYTHPLWMLLTLAGSALWNNPFIISIVLGAVCSTLALFITILTAKRSIPVTAGCLFLPLLLSTSFMDYTSSGLETSLSFLLFAAFGYVVIRLRTHKHFWFYATLTIALALLNRLDLLLIYAPIIGYLAWQDRAVLPRKQLLLGAAPLLLWLAFALLYYGFLFPNSKYAKLDTGLPLLSYLKQGLYYLKFQLNWDIPSLVMLITPLAILLMPQRFEGDKNLLRAFAAGIYAYVAYVFYIGGDYMAGRFWAVPIFAASWLWLMAWPASYTFRHLGMFSSFIIAVALLPPLVDLSKNKVIDARQAFKENQLLTQNPLRIRLGGEYEYAEDGRKMAAIARPIAKRAYSVGMLGYYAGPNTRIVDELALTDPLLARMPAVSSRFYIGHFRRKIPSGYLAYVDTDSTYAMPNALAEYVVTLHLITAGDVWSLERLKTILLFNLGYYEHWKESYLKTR